MKGKTKIILTNVKTGEQEVHEDENLITNALDKLINIEMAMNHAPNTRVLPIATNALGGIMLFDGNLTEDPDNIHFPTEAHLVGYANNGVNTTDKYRGSWNSVESGKTGNGYVSVWDFGTSQANGTIKAVARTHVHGGAAPLYNFNGPDSTSVNFGVPVTDTYWHPIRYDGEYLYMLKANTSTHQMRLARVKIPMLVFGAADYSGVGRTYEVIATWNTLLTSYTYYSNEQYKDQERAPQTYYSYADDPLMYEDGHDGYIYCIGLGATQSYNSYPYDLTYFTIKYSDESYEKSETVRANTGLSKYTYTSNGFRWARRLYGHVNDGVLYMLSGDRKIIYIVPLNNIAAYRSIRILQSSESDYINHLSFTAPRKGGVYFEVYHYTQSSYNYRHGLLYPDGIFILPDVSYANSSSYHNNNTLYGDYCRTNDDDLLVFCYYSDTYGQCSWAANYLGTINNLASPITKTAAQTMKIVYTLTDLEDEEEEEEPIDPTEENGG